LLKTRKALERKKPISRGPRKSKKSSCKPKRPKAPSKSDLMKRADVIWAKIVKLRAGNKCVLCGSVDRLEAHHMITKGSCAFLRYSLENGVCNCGRCHFRFHNQDSQGHWEYLLTHRPKDYYFLKENKHKVCEKRNIGYYRDIILWLTGQLEELEAA